MPGKQNQSLKVGRVDFAFVVTNKSSKQKGLCRLLPDTSSFHRNGTLEDLKGAREIHAEAGCVKALICLAVKS